MEWWKELLVEFPKVIDLSIAISLRVLLCEFCSQGTAEHSTIFWVNRTVGKVKVNNLKLYDTRRNNLARRIIG
jgi:hypothetical protein